jgi:L-threonylcarbamoyladenylate synthase
VRADLGADVDLVLDGGPCAIGVESTIVDLASDPAAPVILRTGAIGAADVERVLGVPVRVAAAGAEAGGVRAPGMLAAHYAPRAGVELVSAAEAGPRAAALAAGGARRVVLVAPPAVAAPGLAAAARIDAPADPAAFAQRLYAMLREADARAADVALVVPPPESGLGIAVRDRLRRAAAGRG